MGQGFYISRTLAVVAGVLAAAAAATIIALAVVLAQERASQSSDNGAGGLSTPSPGGPSTPAPGGISTPSPGGISTPATSGPSTPALGGPSTPATSGPSTPAPPLEPWQRLRLPTDLVPLHYKLSLWPRLEPQPGTNDSYIFTGSSSVLFSCVNSTSLILIHSDRLILSNASGQLAWVWDANGKQLTVEKSWLQNDTQYLVIVLGEPLTPGANYSLYTEFTGRLDDDLRGFYRSQYVDQNGQTRIIATTQMQPTDARKAFPCFDEPAMKATFSISLMHDENHIALSNMPMIGNTSMTVSNVKWYNVTFETTHKMSTYLLAFIVCDFDSVQDISNGTMIRIWARKAAIAQGQGSYALNVTGPILTFFESYYKVPYPLPKSDQIALPDFNAGAMENWGLVTYRETALLYDPLLSSNSNKERVVTVIAHELAHQWFGNLVTLKWWNDLWLNEGFATYVEFLGANYAEPSWNVTLLMVLNDVYRVMAVDALASSHPLSSKEEEVNTPDQINELFDAISYSKGGAVLRMLSNFLTESIFVSGLKEYLTKFSYGNTVYSDLFKELQQAAGEKVQLPMTISEIMNRWTLQMGFPVITINTTNGNIKQQHFLLDPNSNVTRPSQFNYEWIVPIQWMNSDSKSNLTWLMKKEDTKPEMKSAGDKWVLANIDVVGYYRVNYDDRNWDNLIKQLETDHQVLPVLNRAQIIDDSFNLARAEYRKTTSALETTKYLQKEREYIPWQAALNNLAYLRVMLDRSEVFGNMQRYMLQQVTPLYNHFKIITQNWTTPSEGHMDQYNEINAMSVACSYGHEECQNTAQEFFRDWMTSGINKIPLNLKSAVYCSAIASGGQNEWDFAWGMFKNATIATESDKLRIALTCTKEPWLLNRYLLYSLDANKIRKQDATSTISAIGQNVVGQSLTWDFIRANWATIFQQHGGGSFSFSRLISSVTERFSTEFELKQEEIFTPFVKLSDNDFLPTMCLIPDRGGQRSVYKATQLEQFKKDNEHIGFGSGTRAIEQALEKTKANIKWVKANKDSVSLWFSSASAHN